MPELFLKLNQLIADKELERAKELQLHINDIIGKPTSAHGNMYAVIKEVLAQRRTDYRFAPCSFDASRRSDRPVVEAAAAIQETKERSQKKEDAYGRLCYD